MYVHMEPEEVVLFESLLQSADIYLEYGAGGSTYLAEQSSLKKIYSVESDLLWIEKIREYLPKNDRVHFHFADIGKTGEWGFPIEKSPSEIWPRYVLDVWGLIITKPDLILIDGRFRAACSLAALLACSPQTLIAIHDFHDGMPARANYKIGLQFCDIVSTVKNLVVMRKKEQVDPFEIVRELVKVSSDTW